MSVARTIAARAGDNCRADSVELSTFGVHSVYDGRDARIGVAAL